MNEARVDLLPPISATTQWVGYDQTLRIVVIVIADRGRQCSARRDRTHPVRKSKYPPDIKDLRSMVAIGDHYPCGPDHADGGRPPKRSRRRSKRGMINLWTELATHNGTSLSSRSARMPPERKILSGTFLPDRFFVRGICRAGHPICPTLPDRNFLSGRRISHCSFVTDTKCHTSG